MLGQPPAGYRLRVGAGGHFLAHFGKGRGIQHAGHFVDRQQLPIGQHIAPVQRRHILGLNERGFPVGQRNQVTGDCQLNRSM